MRISLIYGEDNEKAYQKFRDLIDGSKKKNFEIIHITNLKDIVRQSLFESKTVFVLEKPNKIKPNDWKWLNKNSSKYNSNLLIYYEGNAPVVITRNLPKDAKYNKFDLPKIIFKFLESFYPGNATNSIKLFNELTLHESVELVFYLLTRHLRDLYWVKISKETMNIPAWRIDKLAKQAEKFEIIDLKLLINELAKIDIKAKTSAHDLKSMLDILTVEHLK